MKLPYHKTNMKNYFTFLLIVFFISLTRTDAAELQPQHEDVLLMQRATIHKAVDVLEVMIRQRGNWPSNMYIGKIIAADSIKLPGDKQIFIFSDPVINLKRTVAIQMLWPKTDGRLLSLDIERRGGIQDNFADGLNDRPGGLLVDVDPFYKGQVLLWKHSLCPTSDSEGRFNVQILPSTWGDGINEASEMAPILFNKSNTELQEYCKHCNAMIRTLAFALLIKSTTSTELIADFHKTGYNEVEVAVRTALMLKKKSEVFNSWLVRHADETTESSTLNGLALGAYVTLAYFDSVERQEAQKLAALIRLKEPARADAQLNSSLALLEHCFARENAHFKTFESVTNVHSLVNALRLENLWHGK